MKVLRWSKSRFGGVHSSLQYGPPFGPQWLVFGNLSNGDPAPAGWAWAIAYYPCTSTRRAITAPALRLPLSLRHKAIAEPSVAKDRRIRTDRIPSQL